VTDGSFIQSRVCRDIYILEGVKTLYPNILSTTTQSVRQLKGEQVSLIYFCCSDHREVIRKKAVNMMTFLNNWKEERRKICILKDGPNDGEYENLIRFSLKEATVTTHTHTRNHLVHQPHPLTPYSL